jgi:hypothetical protein
MLRVVRWLPAQDFRKLSHLTGELKELVKKYRLKNGEAIVVTSMGWHRLCLIARLGDRAVKITPDTTNAPLMTLVTWVQESLR